MSHQKAPLDDSKHVVETASSSAIPMYEDAAVTVGAPTEKVNPLGYHVGAISVLFLEVGSMVGTGIFSTPGDVLAGVGSPGMSLVFWVVGFLFAASYLSVYIEYASYFPHRSGGQVVYLEKAYPKPRYLVPVAYSAAAILNSFGSGNAIVMAEYILAAAGVPATTWRIRGLSVGLFTGIVMICFMSTKWSLRASNVLGILKLLILVFISITGFIALGGHTRVKDPHANFRHAFSGTSHSANGIVNALVKVNYAYGGYDNAFDVLSEVKNPVRTVKRYASLSLAIIFVLYFLSNIAYFAVVPAVEIQTSKELTASLFFKAVFGSGRAVTALNTLLAISIFGNLLSSVIGLSRVIRECGRQGVFPFPAFWASTKPFNTPSAPFLLQWTLTVLVILAPPAGDAFTFIVDLQQYPIQLFSFLMTLGLFFVRKRRKDIGAPRSEFRAWDVVLVFCLTVNIFLLIMPWVPPEGGIYGGDVSFFYATYCIVGLAILFLCVIIYFILVFLLPHLGGYEIRQTVERLSDGAQATRLVKIQKSQIDEWDANHDVHGELIDPKD